MIDMYHPISRLKIGICRFRGFRYGAVTLARLRTPPTEDFTIGKQVQKRILI
jgi:hypothetical protein